LNFLEAAKLVKNFTSERKEHFLFAVSGTADQIVLYLKANAARRGVEAEVSTLPFGTLDQFTFNGSSEGEELFLLTSMDLVPAGDWRSGFPNSTANEQALLEEAGAFVARILSRPHVKIAYLPTPLLPIFPNDQAQANFEAELSELVRTAGACILPPELFSLGSYFATGAAVNGAHASEVAEIIENFREARPPGSCKVLVTDLDNVVWSGVVAEDGEEGISAHPDGVGYMHYVYQSYLLALKNRGILIAVVSRNDLEIAVKPFKTETMPLKEEDFIAFIASYNAKSAQIKALAKQLNLGLEAFVFIDDNPVEIAEVSTALPEVICLQFPKSSDQIPALFSDISRLVRRDEITDEDRNRSELYQRRFKAMAPENSGGADLHEFLRSLNMTLEINEKNEDNFERAAQLINKTNQFNLNGKRFTTTEIGKFLSVGGRLITGTLSDRTGNHGEIICCLIDDKNWINSWVMSCRVFERRLEYAFLQWLAENTGPQLTLMHVPTDRNLPIQKFLEDSNFAKRPDDNFTLDVHSFREGEKSFLDLFSIVGGFDA
jgi:FkbH-like protein